MNNILFYFFFLLLLYQINVVKSKSIYINNNEDNIYDIIKNIGHGNDLKLYFNKEYYVMPSTGSKDINVSDNIYFIGNSNMTTFDFQNKFTSEMRIIFEDYKKYVVTFENIIFKNFSSNDSKLLYLLFIDSKYDNFLINFKNCIFEDSDTLIQSRFTYSKTSTDYNVVFNGCTFRYNILKKKK